jgi:hypothetical protein
MPPPSWLDPEDPFMSIVKIQEQDRKHDAQQEEKTRQNGAAGGSAGGARKVPKYSTRIPPHEWPWRAVDFRREGLLPDKKNLIQRFNKKHWETTQINQKEIKEMEEIEKSKMLPSNFFVNLSYGNEQQKWMWSVKEDGLFVKLIRSDTGEWQTFSRRDILLTPPPSFLAGLEQNKDLPSVMYGELVTWFAGCPVSHRRDKETRNLMRNEQFEKLQFAKLRKKQCNPHDWRKLRVKIFAFPLYKPADDYTEDYTMYNLFKKYRDTMLQTLEYHPHIGMCNFGTLQSTEHAINIFKSVVQLGLEGIVIVRADAEYGALVNRQDDKAHNYFKLKQKIVRLVENLINTGITKEKMKDGETIREHCFRIELADHHKTNFKDRDHDYGNEKTVHFTDMQDRKDATKVRIKFMERAPYYSFPCQGQGYRHMHFAVPSDMSVEVTAVEKDYTLSEDDRKVLGFDLRLNRIRDWDVDANFLGNVDATDKFTRLFNPKPFEPTDLDYEPQKATDNRGSKRDPVDTRDTSGSTHRLLKRKSAGVFSRPNDNDVDKDKDVDDSDRNPGQRSRKPSGSSGSSNPSSIQYFVEKNHDGDEASARQSEKSRIPEGGSRGSGDDVIVIPDDDDTGDAEHDTVKSVDEYYRDVFPRYPMSKDPRMNTPKLIKEWYEMILDARRRQAEKAEKAEAEAEAKAASKHEATTNKQKYANMYYINSSFVNI